MPRVRSIAVAGNDQRELMAAWRSHLLVSIVFASLRVEQTMISSPDD